MEKYRNPIFVLSQEEQVLKIAMVTDGLNIRRASLVNQLLSAIIMKKHLPEAKRQK